MLTLHHLEYSQSFRTLWLLEELGADYELKLYKRDKKTLLAPKEYKEISPTGAAPVITEGALALAETSAISDYILDRVPSETLRPEAGDPRRARYLFWFHAAQGSMMPVMLMDSIFRIMQKRAPFFVKPIIAKLVARVSDGFIKPRMKALLDQAEHHLEETQWIAGEHLTAADIMLSYPMEGAIARGYITKDYPNCRAWMDNVYKVPSFQRAKEKDGRKSMVLPL